jgi:hypothetical protein
MWVGTVDDNPKDYKYDDYTRTFMTNIAIVVIHTPLGLCKHFRQLQMSTSIATKERLRTSWEEQKKIRERDRRLAGPEPRSENFQHENRSEA